MPRIPDVLPREQLQASPSAGYSAPSVEAQRSFAGQQVQQLGAGMQRAGEVLQAYADHQQGRLNDARVMEATNGWLTEVQKRQGEFEALRGRAATGERGEQMLADIQEQRQRVVEALDNDIQREQFERHADRNMVAVRAAFDRHRNREIQAYDMAEAEQFMATAVQSALAAKDDPAAFETAQETAVAAAHRFANLQGWAHDSAQRKALVQKQTTGIYAPVIESLANDGKSSDAAELLAAAAQQDLIDPETSFKLGALVRRATVDDQSQRLATATMQQALQAQRKAAVERSKTGVAASLRPDFAAAFGQGRAAIAAAFDRGEITIEVRDHAIARLQADTRAAGEQQALGDRENLETATKALRDNPFLSWERLPVSLKQSLDAAGLLEAVRDYQRKGLQFTTDQEAKRVFDTTPDSVLRELPPGWLYVQMRKSMDDGDFHAGWARVQAARGQADQKQLQLLSDIDTVKVWARSTLGWTGDLDDDQKAQLNYVVSKVQRRARDARLREGDVQGLEALLKREERNLLLVDGEARPAILLSKAEDAEAGARVPGGDVVPLIKVPGDFQTGVRALVEEWNRRNPGREVPIDDAAVIGIWNAAGQPKTPAEVHRALYEVGTLNLDARASVAEPKSFEETYPEVSYPTTTELLQTGRLTIENLTKPR